MKRLKAGFAIFAVTAILQILARSKIGFAQWYTAAIYPVLVTTIGRIFGLFSFSVIELVFYIFIIFCIWYGIRNLKKPKQIIADTILLLSWIAFSFTINCGINYYGTPFSYESGLKAAGATESELIRLCQYLTVMVNQSVTDTSYTEAWNDEGVKAMTNLKLQYPSLSGYYPKPKGLAVSAVLSIQHLSGFYSPFTIEANYNKDMTGYNIPHTICHELSHLRGFMREDEANFIGYLACINSEHPAYQYSGYLTGWIYAVNQLARENYYEYFLLYEQLDERVVDDLTENSLFWDNYDGKMAETASKVNDTYLKMNQQSEGIKSYGRFVDLMLAYYID